MRSRVWLWPPVVVLLGVGGTLLVTTRPTAPPDVVWICADEDASSQGPIVALAPGGQLVRASYSWMWFRRPSQIFIHPVTCVREPAAWQRLLALLPWQAPEPAPQWSYDFDGDSMVEIGEQRWTRLRRCAEAPSDG